MVNMMTKLKYLMAALAVAACTGMLSGCGGNGAKSTAAAGKTPKDTLVVGLATDIASIDPAVAVDNKAFKVAYPSYERLVQYKKTSDGKASTEVEGSLAKSWKASDDGLTWTFTLNEGHKFADGTAVDAKAVKFSFDRLKGVGKGPSDPYGCIESVEAPDASTVIFHLKKPFAPFLYLMAVDGASVVNPKVMEHQKGNDWGSEYLASHTMGSGPYMLTEMTPGQDIKMKVNPHYGGKKPAIENIIFKVVKDPSAQRLQLENGDLDIGDGIPMDQIDQMRSNKAVQVIESPSLLTNIVYMNNKKAPFDDVKVRQAVSYSVDYKGMVEGTVKGRGLQLSPVPKGLWGYDEKLPLYHEDLNKAKGLLADAGKANGMTVGLLYSDNEPWNETEALLLQNNLQQAGIQVKLEKVAWATFRERVDKGDFDMAMGVWSPDYADPHMFLSRWFDSSYFGLAGNRSFYKNDEVDKLLREAEVMTDQAGRVKLYNEVQEKVMADAPYLFLFQTNVLTPMRSNIKGYVYNPMLDDMYNFEDMSKE